MFCFQVFKVGNINDGWICGSNNVLKMVAIALPWKNKRIRSFHYCEVYTLCRTHRNRSDCQGLELEDVH